MVDFDFEIHGEEGIKDDMTKFVNETKGVANEALVEFAKECKDEIESTAPVDTGEYRDSWYIIQAKENLVYLVNNAEHGKYVVFPNSAMVGSPSADLPSQGILHNVRGIIHEKKSEYEASFIQKLRNKLF